MVFAPALCSQPNPPTWYLPNSTPTWIGSTQTSRPFVHFSYLSSFTCYLPVCSPTNWFVSCRFKFILISSHFCFLFSSPLFFVAPRSLPWASAFPNTPQLPHGVLHATDPVASHNMALFLCAVCSCVFIAAQAWMPLCFEEWQSVTHGAWGAGNLYKSAKWRPAGHLACFSFAPNLSFHLPLFERHWVAH